jgi:hypothetical protein
MISSTLYAALEEDYLLGRIQKVEALTGEEWNTVLRLDCDRGAFVLRISHPTTTAAALRYEHRLLQFMSRRIPEVPAPMVDWDGCKFEGGYFLGAGTIFDAVDRASPLWHDSGRCFAAAGISNSDNSRRSSTRQLC